MEKRKIMKIKSVKELPEIYMTAVLVLYAVFPLINYCRRMNGGALYFTIWRDYLYFALGGALLLLAILVLTKRLTVTEIGVKSFLKENASAVFLAGLIIWMIISSAVTGFCRESVVGNERSRTGMICSVVYCLVFFLTLFIHDTGKIRIFMGFFLTIGLVLNVNIILNYFLGTDMSDIVNYNYIFYNSNHLGYFLLCETVCAMVVFVLTEDKIIRIVSPAVYFTGTASLIITNALGTIVAQVITVVFALIILLLTGRLSSRTGILKYLLCIALWFVAGVILFVVPTARGTSLGNEITVNLKEIAAVFAASKNIKETPNELGSARILLWKEALKRTGEKPIFGNGLGAMRNYLLEVSHGGINTVHNEFLEYCSNYGIPALILYLAFIFSVYIRGARHRKELTDINIISLITAFAYLVSSVFGVTMFYTAPYLFIFLALGNYRKQESYT